jgi:hypothetical protein
MNQVTRRRLKRLEMDDYDLGHLDTGVQQSHGRLRCRRIRHSESGEAAP